MDDDSTNQLYQSIATKLSALEDFASRPVSAQQVESAIPNGQQLQQGDSEQKIVDQKTLQQVLATLQASPYYISIRKSLMDDGYKVLKNVEDQEESVKVVEPEEVPAATPNRSLRNVVAIAAMFLAIVAAGSLYLYSSNRIAIPTVLAKTTNRPVPAPLPAQHTEGSQPQTQEENIKAQDEPKPELVAEAIKAIIREPSLPPVVPEPEPVPTPALPPVLAVSQVVEADKTLESAKVRPMPVPKPVTTPVKKKKQRQMPTEWPPYLRPYAASLSNQ